MSFLSRLPSWLVLLVWAISAIWAPLTPARAVLAAACLEWGFDREGNFAWHAAFRHLPAVFLLHALRPDASLWLSLSLVVAVNLVLALPSLIRRQVAWLGLLCLCVPLLLQAALVLGQRDVPSELTQVSLWHHAAPVENDFVPTWWFRAPPHLSPMSLESTSTRHRALLLLVGLLAIQAFGLARRRPAYESLAGLLLLLGVPDQSEPVDLHLYPSAFESRMAETRVAHEGQGLVKLGPPRRHEVDFPEKSSVVAWVEHAPLHAPKSAGNTRDIELLEYWAAGDDLPEGLGVRWELLANKSLVRKLLP